MDSLIHPVTAKPLDQPGPTNSQSSIPHNQYPIATLGLQFRTPVALSQDNTLFAYVDAQYTVYLQKFENKQIKSASQLFGSRSRITDLAFSLNQKFLAASNTDGFIVFDIESQESMFHFNNDDTNLSHEGNVTTIMFYDDNLIITGGEDYKIKIWTLMQGQLVGNAQQQLKRNDGKQNENFHLENKGYQLKYLDEIVTHKAPITGIIRSPNDKNRIVSYSQDGQIRLIDISGLIDEKPDDQKAQHGTNVYAIIHSFEAHRSDVNMCSFSQSGRLLMSGSKDNYLNIYDLQSGLLISHFAPFQSDVVFVRFVNKDEYILCASFAGEFKIYKTSHQNLGDSEQQQMQNQQMLQQNVEQVQEVNTHDLQATIQSAESMLRKPDMINLLKAQTEDVGREPIAHFFLHECDMHKVVAGSTLPILITAQQNQYLKVWDISSVAQPVLLKEYFGHLEAISGLIALSHQDMVLLSSGKDGLFSANNITYQLKLFAEKANSAITCVTFDEKLQQIFIGTSVYEIRGYQLKQSQPPQLFASFQGHMGSITALQVVNGFLISGSQDFSVKTWKIPPFKDNDIKQVSCNKTYEDHDGTIAAICHNEAVVCTAGGDHKIVVYGIGNCTLLRKKVVEKAHSGAIVSLCISTNSTLYSASQDGTIKAWTVQSMNANPVFNAGRTIDLTRAEDPFEIARELKDSSSEKCQICTAIPKVLGLPNSLCLWGSNVCVGMTNGAILIFDYSLLEKVICQSNNDLLGDAVTALVAIGDFIASGTLKGTIQVWNINGSSKAAVQKIPKCGRFQVE